MKKYLITAGVLLVLATGFSLWRENCTDGCLLQHVVFGWPVFLRTPYSPGSSERPSFFLIPLLINLGWSAVGSVIGWSIFDTFARWQDRKQPPEFPGV